MYNYSKILNPGDYLTWLQKHLIDDVENEFRNFLEVDKDAKLSYFLNKCISQSGHCENKHKWVWYGGIDVVDFIKKAAEHNFVTWLYVTAEKNKSSAIHDTGLNDYEYWDYKSNRCQGDWRQDNKKYEEEEVYHQYSDEYYKNGKTDKVNTYYIGEFNSNGIAECDEIWGWLWRNVLGCEHRNYEDKNKFWSRREISIC